MGEQRAVGMEDPFRRVFAESREAYMLLADGVVIECNDSATALFQCRRDDLIGRTPEGLSPALQPSGESSGDADRRMAGIAWKKGCHEYEWLFQRPDGSCFTMEAFLSATRFGDRAALLLTLRDATARLAAEQDFRMLFHEMLDGFALHEVITNEAGEPVDYRFLAINPAFERLTGFTPEMVLGRKVREVFPGIDPEWIAMHGKVALGGAPLQFEHSVSHLPKYFDVKVFSPAPRRFVTIFSDITERRKAENDLRASRQFLDDVIENSGALVFVKDVEGRYQLVNRKWLQVTGHTRENTIGKTDDDLFPGEIGQAFRRQDLEVMARGEVTESEEVLDDATGRRIFLSIKFPMRDAQGAVSGVCGMTTEITARRRAEKALGQLDARFRSLLEKVEYVGVQGYRPDGTTVYWNKASERIYGYPASEALGRNLIELVIPPAMRQEVARNVRSMTASGEAIQASELTLQRRDGSPVVVYSNHVVLQDADGNPELYCIDVDLTPLREMERERESLQAMLNQAQKMESVGRLAGGVAHDFNNMLAVILGHCELALQTIDPKSPLHGDLLEIRRAADRSADLTRQLLAFARRQTIAPKVLDLNKTVESMLKMLRRLIGEQIVLEWKPGPALWPVEVDPTQIDQILANLCVNARDAIGGVGTIRIETACVVVEESDLAAHPNAAPGAFVTLAVSDNGCGMDQETLSMIFEPFFTTKPVGEGTGLGLATIYGAVKQNRGFVEVSSEKGKGTTFTIHLPAHVADMESSGTDSSATKSGIASRRGSETILLVEDEQAILRMTKTMLERSGYEVLAASSPEEAIRQAKQLPGTIDLLLTDVIMPTMNGWDLSHRIMMDHPNIRTIFMSGYTANTFAAQGKIPPETQFLQKPFSNKELLRMVRGVLDGGG